MRMATSTTIPDDTVTDNLFRIFLTATPMQFHQGMHWYDEARATVDTMRDIDPTLSVECAASILSAFSPRCRWSTNKAKALRFAARLDVSGLSSHRKAATEARSIGFCALRGMKTNAFARNIAGDLSAVTVDTWMHKAAGYDNRKAPTVRQYRQIADAITYLANANGIAPAQMQAIIWIALRGNHE